MSWPEIPPSKPMSRARLIALITVAVAGAGVIGVQGFRSGQRAAAHNRGTDCPGIVRTVTPAIAASNGQDTPGLQGAMRIVVQHPECFPKDIIDTARDLLDTPAPTAG